MSAPQVLDTNILSELVRPAPDPAVLEWMRINGDGAYLTVVSRAELRFGVARMPQGARRTRIAGLIETVLAEFEQDTLPFDRAAADSYGELAARRERVGGPKSMADTMIAAICLVNGFGVVTRNTRDFEDVGLPAVTNPFSR